MLLDLRAVGTAGRAGRAHPSIRQGLADAHRQRHARCGRLSRRLLRSGRRQRGERHRRGARRGRLRARQRERDRPGARGRGDQRADDAVRPAAPANGCVPDAGRTTAARMPAATRRRRGHGRPDDAGTDTGVRREADAGVDAVDDGGAPTPAGPTPAHPTPTTTPPSRTPQSTDPSPVAFGAGLSPLRGARRRGAPSARAPGLRSPAPRSGERVRVRGPVPPLCRACLIRGFRRICRR